MDAIVGVWITSVVGSAAFSAAGYVFGSSRRPPPVVLPAPALLPAAIAAPIPAASGPVSTRPPLSRPPVISVRISAAEKSDPPPPTKKTPTAFPPPALLERSAEGGSLEDFLEDDETEDRPTVVPDVATQAAALQSSVVTIPPPQRAPSLGVPGYSDSSAQRAMIQDALAQVEHAAEQTKSLEIIKHELERQLDVARAELRNEAVLRAAAEARSEELSDRLARASEEAGSLRHRVNMLDRQTKLLRESLKGGRPAPPETRARRDLEEAEEMRAKLRDVVDKLERASHPPPSAVPKSSVPGMTGVTAMGMSGRPTPPGGFQRVTPSAGTQRVTPSAGFPRVTAPPPSAQFPSAPGMPRMPFMDESSGLREEIARLAAENRSLRAQTLGSLPPKQTNPRDSVPEIDFPLYENLMERLNSVAGLKCSVLADEVGSLILGSGELSENLAAFGAYIRDASARTERLLPLDGVEEIDIRDPAGMLLSTRVVQQKNALSIVLLASAEASIVAAKKVIDEGLRGRR